MTEQSEPWSEDFEHFIEIDDESGHIGNIFWRNTVTRKLTSRHRSEGELVTQWGCFVPHFVGDFFMLGGVIEGPDWSIRRVS